LSGHPSIVPFHNFPPRDGWLVVACAKDKFWRLLCGAIDRPDLLEDPRYESMAERSVHRAELVAELAAVFAQRDVADWVDALSAAGVPVAPVLDVPAAFEEPQVAARGVVAGYEHPRFGEVRTARSAARVGTDRPALRRGPRRGEHTDALLRGLLGYSPERVAALRRAGVFGAC
jgi:crotonobetainyl-CoA:carnitine CoA-transferase CaiB-like acyl-CoA transferase